MNSTEILNALNVRLLERWSERTVYVDVCPKDFDRPSFWLSVTRDDRTRVTRALNRRRVQIQLVLFDEVDEHYESSWYRLSGEACECMQLLGGVLAVGQRRLLPSLQSTPREPDRAAILINFEFMESVQEETAEIPPADSLQISVQVNGGEIYQRSE